MEYTSRARRGREVYSIRDFKFKRAYGCTPVNKRVLDSIEIRVKTGVLMRLGCAGCLNGNLDLLLLALRVGDT